jgi:hypothetical protein
MGPFAGEREVQDSLAPVQLDVRSVDEEVASMNRGKGVQLLAIAVVVVGAISGGVLTMQRLDRDRAYEQAGAATQELRRTHVTAFVQCALPFAQSSSMESRERLYAAFADMIERSANGYAQVLRQCESKLLTLPPALGALRAPSEIRGPIARLRESSLALQQASSALRGALEDPAQREDYVAVTARADHLAKAVFAYEDRDEDLRNALTARR